MRVTQNSSFDTLNRTIHRSKARMEKYQEQASSLKKLNAPSDDPAGSAKVLEIRTDKVNNDQFLSNSKLAEAFLNHSDHALSELGDLLLRAKEIALSQSSGASSTKDSRLAIAEEIEQIGKQAVSLANTKIGDRFVFGGYRTDRPPVDEEGVYHGDRGQMMIEVGKDVFISMNVPGYEVFNSSPENSVDYLRTKEEQPANENESKAPTERPPGVDGAGRRTLASVDHPQHKESLAEGKPLGHNYNVFSELQKLRLSLLTGDIEGIRSTLESMDELHANVVANRSKIGSRVNGLQSSMRSMERQNLTNAELTSSIEDADMVDVMNNLAKEETILRTALSSAQRLVQPTLIDFLK